MSLKHQAWTSYLLLTASVFEDLDKGIKLKTEQGEAGETTIMNSFGIYKMRTQFIESWVKQNEIFSLFFPLVKQLKKKILREKMTFRVVLKIVYIKFGFKLQVL